MTYPINMNNHGTFLVCFSLLGIVDTAVEENVTINIDKGATRIKGEDNDHLKGERRMMFNLNRTELESLSDLKVFIRQRNASGGCGIVRVINNQRPVLKLSREGQLVLCQITTQNPGNLPLLLGRIVGAQVSTGQSTRAAFTEVVTGFSDELEGDGTGGMVSESPDLELVGSGGFGLEGDGPVGRIGAGSEVCVTGRIVAGAAEDDVVSVGEQGRSEGHVDEEGQEGE